MYHPTAMLKHMLPKLTARSKQSGLVIVSSVASQLAMPAGSIYSASKAYVSQLALAVDSEI